jgi:hypothetical protein
LYHDAAIRQIEINSVFGVEGRRCGCGHGQGSGEKGEKDDTKTGDTTKHNYYLTKKFWTRQEKEYKQNNRDKQ